MPRVVLIALILLAAGCVTPAADVDTASVAAPIPALLKAEGATVRAVAGGVMLAWEGEATQALTSPVGGPALQPAKPAVLDLAMPPEVTLIHAWLNWSGDVTLRLAMVNDSNVRLCGAYIPDDGRSECFATLYLPRDGAQDWTATVSALGSGPDPATVPFTLDVLLGTTPLPMLGLPAPLGPEAAMQFAPPVLLSEDDTHTAEPSIAVTPKGTVYVAAPVGPQRALWRSADGGATFSEVAIHAQPTDPLSFYPNGGGDSDVAVSGDDTVYFADQHVAETVSASHDGGQTWSTQPLGSGAPFADRQWLVTDGPMNAWLAYNGARGAMISKTVDGGHAWLALGNVPEDDCFRGNLARDPAGNLYLGGCDENGPGVGVSKDGGLTWTWSQVATRKGETDTSFVFPGHLFVIVSADADGNVYVAWSDEAQESEDTGAPKTPHGLNVWLASSTDQGATWSKPHRVNGPDGTYVLPWVTAGAGGRVAVAYYGTKFVGHPERVLGEWYPIVAVTEDALAEEPVFIESVASSEPVQYGPVCMRGSGCGNARNLLDFFQIQADSDGHVHMAYVDGRAGGNYRFANIMYLKQLGGLDLGGRSIDKDGGVTALGLPKLPVLG